MASVKKTNFDGDPNLGLHAECTENFCIMDPSLSEKCYRRVSETLEVEVIKAPVASSRMCGIFCAANSQGVVLPRNVEENEKKLLEDKDIKFKVIDSKQTALGNLILVNDDFGFISEKLEPVKEDIKDCFEVTLRTAEIAGLDLLGTSGVVTNEGLLCHRDVSEDEMEFLEEKFDLTCGRGTANFGMPFVGASIVANSKGILVSSRTTGPELGRIRESLLPENEE